MVVISNHMVEGNRLNNLLSERKRKKGLKLLDKAPTIYQDNNFTISWVP